MNVAEWPLYSYRAEVLRVVDGDTLIARVSVGMRMYREASIRLAGFDAPELFSGTPEERAAGLIAKVTLEAAIGNGFVAEGTTVWLKTYRDKLSFDRYVADVFVERGGALVDVTTLIQPEATP